MLEGILSRVIVCSGQMGIIANLEREDFLAHLGLPLAFAYAEQI